MYRLGQKAEPLCYTAFNCRIADQIGTKFDTSQCHFILHNKSNLFKLTLKNKIRWPILSVREK